MSNRGLWVFLGMSAVAGAMITTTGCGDDAAPGNGAGTAGAAGTPPIVVKGGNNAGGGATGKGGSGTGATGGTSAAGGKDPGTSGSGGSGVTPGLALAQKALGKTCVKDAECKAGGKCFTDTTPFLSGAAMPGGICVIDCLEDESVCGDKAICVGTAGEPGAPATAAYCLLSCTIGDITGQEDDKTVQAKLGSRCGGRRDMRCGAASEKGTDGFCLPFCAGDPDYDPKLGGVCPSSLACDTGIGGCVDPASIAGLKKTGESCTAGGGTRECGGECIPFDAPPGAKTAPGVCADGCLLGLPMCVDGGLCAFAATGAGILDAGACTEKVGKNKDEDCNWQLGLFSTTITVDSTTGEQGSFCFGAPECKNDSECRSKCKSDVECGAAKEGEAGAEGKCEKGFCSILANHCYSFDATTTAKSGCIDHKPTVGGATATNPAGGSGGAGGAAGAASGGAAGAASGGAAGAASGGSAGAAAGAGGALTSPKSLARGRHKAACTRSGARRFAFPLAPISVPPSSDSKCASPFRC